MTIRRTVLSGIAVLLATVAGEAGCSYRRNNVPFSFVNEYKVALHQGGLNVITGKAKIVVDKIQYTGVLRMKATDSVWTYGTGKLQASNGAMLSCDIHVRDDGFGRGQCRGAGDVVYEVAMRDTPRM